MKVVASILYIKQQSQGKRPVRIDISGAYSSTNSTILTSFKKDSFSPFTDTFKPLSLSTLLGIAATAVVFPSQFSCWHGQP
jgi:hypothetical protein